VAGVQQATSTAALFSRPACSCRVAEANHGAHRLSEPRRGRCSVSGVGSSIAPSVLGHPMRHRSLRQRGQLHSYVDGEGPSGEVYQGMFGPWKVEPEDEREVAAYRSGIAVCAAALTLGSLGALLPQDLVLTQLLRRGSDLYAASAALGLGTSLYFIHIYVTPLKIFVQALWAAGVAGAIGIAATQGAPMVQHVAEHPSDVWLVGPFFAAVTGVAFKEGLCYGKAEAAGLFFVTPALLLSHLTGQSEPVQDVLLAAFTALVMVFAARKFTQPIKDDIGDKSVFEFQKLSKDEQEAKLAIMRESRDPLADE